MKTLAEIIKTSRQTKGLSVRKLSQAIDCSPSYITCIESGKNPSISEDMARKISDVLEIDFLEIMYLNKKIPNDVINVIFNSFESYKKYVESTCISTNYAYQGQVSDAFKEDVEGFMSNHADVLSGLAR